MTELKTLKDLKYSSHCSKCKIITIDPEELKAEAIKWVKHYWGIRKKDIERGLLENCTYYRGRCDELIQFFNLTEEDFK